MVDNPNPTSKPPVNPIAKLKATAKRTQFIALIACILAIAALAFAGYLWQPTASNKVVTLKKQLEENRLENKANLDVLKSQLQQQQKSFTSIQSNLDQILRTTTDRTKQRVLSQVSYLLQLANLHLNIGHDVKTSTKLLNLANQRIQKLDDSSLFTLKHALANDLEKLKNARSIDTTTLILRLDSLNDKIQQLKMIPQHLARATTKQPQKVTQDTSQLPWYKKFWSSLGSLKDLVIIRHYQKPKMPLITPQQVSFLKENIQVKISQAEWAVLHQQPKLYQHSLQMVQQWTSTYFLDSSATKAVRDKLAQLQKINIKPGVPDISDSLNALDKSMANNSSDNTKSLPKKIKTLNSNTQPTKPGVAQ